MTSPSRSRRTIAVVAALAAALAGAVAWVVVGGSDSADAQALQRFESCAELEAWGEQSASTPVRGVDGFGVIGEVAERSEGSSAAPAAETATDGAALDTGGTNVMVEGVDEFDLVDHIDDDTVLVSSLDRLTLVDLAAGEQLASLDVGALPTISYDPEHGVAWVVAQDDHAWTLIVQRVTVTSDSLSLDGSWELDGYEVASRRIGGRLHVVATDDFGGGDQPTLPFSGEPVPCDQVLHPEGPSAPSATLLATFEPDGAVEPSVVTQVVGSGEMVHLTHDAVYLATPRWDQDEVTTAIHRFALDGLSLTGSGEVEGSLLNEFSMSAHEGHLRLAITHGGAGAVAGPAVGAPLDPEPVPMPEPVEPGDPEPVPMPEPVEPGDPEPVPMPEPVEPVDPEPLEPVDPQPGIDEPAPRPEPLEPGSEPVEPPTEIAPPTSTAPDEGPVLNEIVVLDTQGDLDVVGRTDRFGKPYETIHGIRFVGEVAYAVTFLAIDPFYVVDLSDPTSPAVTGEVELPGFSTYLHPVGDDHVLGFGPDERGMASAKLFDVSDPTAPEVVDSVVLGEESAVVWDHHAFVTLDQGRFAVPVVEHRSGIAPGCTEEDRRNQAAELDRFYAEIFDPEALGAIGEDWTVMDDAWRALDQRRSELPCAEPEGHSVSSAVTLEVADGRLVEVARQETRSASAAHRIIPSSAGWAFLDGASLVLLDPDGAERASIALSN